MSRRARQGACVSLSALVALVITACGGGSTSSTSVARVPVQVAHPQTPIPKPLGVGRDKIQASRTAPVRARPPQAGTDDDEINSTGRKTLNPCTLVKRAEVQAAVHDQIGRPVYAPQGPTCIYKPQHAKRQITIAVESIPFSKVKPQEQLRDRISLEVAGHAAYCGTAGGSTMIVPLPEGRYLTVTAPCPIAASLATKALSRIV